MGCSHGDGAFYAVAPHGVNAGRVESCRSATMPRRAVPPFARGLGRHRRLDDPLRPPGDSDGIRAAPGRLVHAFRACLVADDPAGTGVRVRVLHPERFGRGESFVIAANHESFYDILVLFARLPMQISLPRQAQPLPVADSRLVDGGRRFRAGRPRRAARAARAIVDAALKRAGKGGLARSSFPRRRGPARASSCRSRRARRCSRSGRACRSCRSASPGRSASCGAADSRSRRRRSRSRSASRSRSPDCRAAIAAS